MATFCAVDKRRYYTIWSETGLVRHTTLQSFKQQCALIHCTWLVSLLQEIHGGSDTKCPLMVKVLDAVKGIPAGSVLLKVSQQTADGGWTQIANGYIQTIDSMPPLPPLYKSQSQVKSKYPVCAVEITVRATVLSFRLHLSMPITSRAQLSIMMLNPVFIA